VLRKRAYRGELHYGRFSNLNAHEPLVDEAIWQRAQTESLSIRLDKSPHPALLGGTVKQAIPILEVRMLPEGSAVDSA
jgi:hypothetical protein